ncbi:MAG TPA: VWA domain-containing protein [Candidatus Acidoferrales bacterium]|nr:VWA domain-containing protein [Candidatus Acidoferrales bacterium]
MGLAHPFWLLLLILIPVPWLMLRRKGFLGHSNVRLTAGMAGSTILYRLPLAFLSISFALLVVSLAQPQRLHVESEQTIKARDIMIAVDISGSMGSPFDGEIPKLEPDPELDKALPPAPPQKRRGPENPNEFRGNRRIDAAQWAVLSFIRDRWKANAGDRVGIIVFDSAPYYSWPLTHDLRQIYRKGQFVGEGLGGGTNFGDSKPGPIDAAADHFDELGKATTKVLIMVTDGEDNISEMTKSRLKSVLQSRGISFYVVGVGQTLAERDVDIIRFAEDVGGKVFRVENTTELEAGFKTIDKMERTVISVTVSNRHEEMFFYFAGAAVIFLLLGLVAAALILNE